MQQSIDYNFPDIHGRFGKYGGKYVPETLITPLKELEEVYSDLSKNREFQDELDTLNKEYSGRPTPLTFAEGLTKHYNRAKIYLKRENIRS